MKVFSTILAGAVILGGIGLGAQALAKGNDEELQYVYEAEAVHAASNEGNGISLSEATEIALAQVENGVVSDVEKDYEKGQLVYEVEVKTDEYEHEFKINQQDGKVVKEKTEKRDGKRRSNDHSNENIISIDQAVEIALNEVPGTIDNVEIERENGQIIYEIEVENETHSDDEADVYINAVTGEILYVEWDD